MCELKGDKAAFEGRSIIKRDCLPHNMAVLIPHLLEEREMRLKLAQRQLERTSGIRKLWEPAWCLAGGRPGSLNLQIPAILGDEGQSSGSGTPIFSLT